MKINYNKGLISHIEELTDQNERLTMENKILRADNRELRVRLNNLEKTLESRIAAVLDVAVKKATEPLLEEIKTKNILIEKLDNEIDRLKAQINKNSGNSSKPPSTNGFKNIQSNREKSGRPQGGQKGHPGHRLQLPKNIEELTKAGKIEIKLNDHTCGSTEYMSRYIINVHTKVIITEHRYAKTEEIPEKMYNEVTYGDELKAMVILLLKEGIIAKKRLSEIISGMTSGVVELSTGTMDKIEREFSQKLSESGELEAIKNDLLNGEVMNTDDTPIRTQERIVYPKDELSGEPPKFERAEKKSFKATVRTHSNERSTLYTVNPQKNIEGIERDNILPQYRGKLCHDHESKFYNYGSDNGTCGHHLCRELKGLSELFKCPWSNKMRLFMLEMNKHKNGDMASGKSFCDPEELSLFESEYSNLLKEGRRILSQIKEGDWGYSERNAILNRLEKYKDNYTLFMRNYNVPFTNNLAERDLRQEKTKQKVSGLFRSWNGITRHVIARSFISTAKKRGEDLCVCIKKIFVGEPVFGS
jgi:hypothetical protein